MADPDLVPSSTRRRLARQRRRRRRNRALSVVAGVLGAGIAMLAVTDTIRLPAGEGPKLAGGAEPVSSGEATQRPQPSESEIRRALTPGDPLRLWIAGDSLAGSLGPSLGAMTAATGVVQPQYDSRVSSGLGNPSFFNWPRHATQQLAELDPEAIVFVVGTNDANAEADTDPQQYASATEAMMRVLTATGAPVYWVNAPVMRDDDLEESVVQVNEIQRTVAARFPSITYVDAHRLFASPQGEYTSRLPDDTGNEVTMRAGDGIHFTAEGADYLARAVYALLDDDWSVTRQAVPDQPKRVIESEGSTQVTGTYRSSGSSSGASSWNGTARSSSSGTTSTTAAPVVTTAPPVATTAVTTTTTAVPPGP